MSLAIALLNAFPTSEQCAPAPCMMPPPPPPMPYLAPPLIAMPPPVFLPPPMPLPAPAPAYALFFTGNRGKGGDMTTTTSTTTQNPMDGMNFAIAIPIAPSFGMPAPPMIKFSDNCKPNKPNNDCRESSDSASTSSESKSIQADSMCSDEKPRGRGKKKRRKSRKKSRRSLKKRPRLVKPVLSYVARDGKVHFETKISNVEAFQLLNDRDKKSMRSDDAPRSVKIVTKSNGDGKNRLVVIASGEEVILDGARRNAPRRVNTEVNQLTSGKKRIIFNPPENRKITNMSIAFQIE